MSLYPTFIFGDVDLAAAPFLVEFGHDRGSPEAIVAKVLSSLRDGSLTEVTGYDNREVSISVLIEAADLLTLAEAEAVLVAEALKPRNEFTFNPGDGFAADSVYDTYQASLEQVYDDEWEVQGYRRFVLTFEAHPWPRSSTKVITPAIATAPTAPVVVDDGSSTTNWSATYPSGAVVSVVSGAVTSTYDPDLVTANTYYGTGLRRLATIDTSVNRYIAVDWKSSIAGAHFFRPGSENLPELMRQPAPTSGFTRSWYRVDGASVSEINFGVIHVPSPAASATLAIDQVVQSDRLPASGTARQKRAAVFPGGSISAQGDVVVQHATAGLGQTVVYSHPFEGGYSPPLRPWLASSDAVTADSAARNSGFFHSLTGMTRFHIPISAVPRGDVHMWAAMGSSSGTGDVVIHWTARSLVGGVVVGEAQYGTTRVNFPVVGQWAPVPLARFTLPTTHVGPAGYIYIDMQRDGGASQIINLDEAWLFGMDKGRLTVVDCGEGAPSAGAVSNRLKVVAPSLDEPFGAIRVATAADWSDEHAPAAAKVLSDQTGHQFDPAGSGIFTVTAGASDAAVSLEHYPRWHSNAGR